MSNNQIELRRLRRRGDVIAFVLIGGWLALFAAAVVFSLTAVW
jgi:hypothetical protein